MAKGAEPDCRLVHVPLPCDRCGEGLEESRVTATEVRLVFDLLPRCLEVTERQAQHRLCRRGATTKAAFSPEALSATC